MHIKRRIILSIFVIAAISCAHCQNVAVKTNLLTDLLLNATGGVEIGLSPHWSLDMTVEYNGWTVNEHKWKHLMVRPEARYWFCDRFAKHFLGIHALGGKYNFANIKNGIKFLGTDFSPLSDYRYQGWAIGAGIAYGYAWALNKHWNIEAEIGIGYIYTRYDQFECGECGSKLAEDQPHHYVGPTKAALNLVYVF